LIIIIDPQLLRLVALDYTRLSHDYYYVYSITVRPTHILYTLET